MVYLYSLRQIPVLHGHISFAWTISDESSVQPSRIYFVLQLFTSDFLSSLIIFSTLLPQRSSFFFLSSISDIFLLISSVYSVESKSLYHSEKRSRRTHIFDDFSDDDKKKKMGKRREKKME